MPRFGSEGGVGCFVGLAGEKELSFVVREGGCWMVLAKLQMD